MRLAVLSDIHGNLTAFEAALADLEAQGGADITWFLGDLAAFGPRPAECVQRVKAMVDAVKDDEQKNTPSAPFTATPTAIWSTGCARIGRRQRRRSLASLPRHACAT